MALTTQVVIITINKVKCCFVMVNIKRSCRDVRNSEPSVFGGSESAVHPKLQNKDFMTNYLVFMSN